MPNKSLNFLKTESNVGMQTSIKSTLLFGTTMTLFEGNITEHTAACHYKEMIELRMIHTECATMV